MIQVNETFEEFCKDCGGCNHQFDMARCRRNIMVGEKIKVMFGASKWMKERGYWLDSMGDSVDGMVGKVNGDYTNLKGDDSHWSIDLGLDCEVGVHPQFVEAF